MGAVGFLSHLIACAGFALLAAALLVRREQTAASLWLAAAATVTAVWAGIVALAFRYGADYIALMSPAETLRSAAWIAFLAALLAKSWRASRELSSSFVVAVGLAGVLAVQLAIDFADELTGAPPAAPIAYLAVLARLTVAIGGLVLVHNLYINTVAANRWSIRLSCIGLAFLFGYDLNMYTLRFLSGALDLDLFAVRGAANALVVPLIALSAWRNRRWDIQVSRQVMFHTLSLMAIGGYLIVMAIAAWALRLLGGDWGSLLQIGFLVATMILAVVVIFSGRFRASARVWIAKHFFAYKYDYRQEWLRLIATVSRSGSGHGGLAERVIQGVCDIVDSPGGVLYVPGDDGAFEPAARWNYRNVVGGRIEADAGLVRYLADRGRIVDFDELRGGGGDYGADPAPSFLLDDRQAWLAVPLVHLERLAGFIVVERSLARRDLNWEDFDLLRTVGRQAASYIAEAASQAALSEAQKFDEFNRRFAFIMHDIKNLVSQLSLVARNAERHADNPAFRADMVATLQSSVGKMNDLLARLAQHNSGKPDEASAVDLTAIVAAVVADKQRLHGALSFDAGARPLSVVGDPVRIEQLFAHLLQNAIDASEPGAPVRVAMTADGGTARVDIIDQGTGMSAAFVRNELFKPFRSTKADGFGIGAYEARQIVQALGGRLDVASREGEGTIFTVRVPLAAELNERKRA
jgi:putative PEP-CTERM system histidine kinase